MRFFSHLLPPLQTIVIVILVALTILMEVVILSGAYEVIFVHQRTFFTSSSFPEVDCISMQNTSHFWRSVSLYFFFILWVPRVTQSPFAVMIPGAKGLLEVESIQRIHLCGLISLDFKNVFDESGIA